MFPPVSRPALVASLLGLLAACGSRSTLTPSGADDTAGSGATGGQGGAGAGTSTPLPTGTAGAGGGAGGAPISCDTVVLDGLPRSPATHIGGAEQGAPRLVPIEADASRAALVYEEAEQLSFGTPKSASVALETPWGAWPDSLATSGLHFDHTGMSVGGGESGRISLLTRELSNPAVVPTGMFLWTPTAGQPGSEGQFFDDLSIGAPRLVAAGQSDWIAGFSLSTGGASERLALARLTSPIPSSTFAGDFACAKDAPLSGAALPWGEGYLLAISNGRPFGTCSDDQFSDSAPERLQVVLLPGPVNAPVLQAEYAESGTHVHQVLAAPSATGAWLAWERVPPGFEADPPAERRLQLFQIDAAGLPKTGKIITLDLGITGTPIGLATVGDLPVLATFRDSGDGGVVDVSVFGELGEPLGQITLPPEDGLFLELTVSLLGSPSGGHVLVAWGETGAQRRVRVARLACAGL
jgi:hypothetical protein